MTTDQLGQWLHRLAEDIATATVDPADRQQLLEDLFAPLGMVDARQHASAIDHAAKAMRLDTGRGGEDQTMYTTITTAVTMLETTLHYEPHALGRAA